MFVLQLNDMRASNIENVHPRARAETPEELEALLTREKVDSYREDRWQKSFRKGGFLEWCNQPFSFDPYIVDVGSEDSWANDAREQYRNQIDILPHAKEA